MKFIQIDGVQKTLFNDAREEKTFSESVFSETALIGGNKGCINFGEWVEVWGISVLYSLVCGAGNASFA